MSKPVTRLYCCGTQWHHERDQTNSGALVFYTSVKALKRNEPAHWKECGIIRVLVTLDGEETSPTGLLSRDPAERKRALKKALADGVAVEMKAGRFNEAYALRQTTHAVALAVRDLREKAGLSRAQLAAKLGLRTATVTRLEESAHLRPRYDLLARVAVALSR